MFSISPNTSIPDGAGRILARERENVTIFAPADKIAEETVSGIGCCWGRRLPGAVLIDGRAGCLSSAPIVRRTRIRRRPDDPWRKMTSVTVPSSGFAEVADVAAWWQRSEKYRAQSVPPVNGQLLSLAVACPGSLSAIRQGAGAVMLVHRNVQVV